MVAEDYARKFESGDLAQDSVKDTAGEEQRMLIPKIMCRLCFSGEHEGSEKASRMLSCNSCGKKYHCSCLKAWSQNRDLFHWSSWKCPSCQICEAVLKQFAGGLGGSDSLSTDDNELQQYQKHEKLYISTCAAKHFQRDVIRGVEGYIVTGSKQVEIGTKLSEGSRKYCAEITCTSGSTLSKAALSYSGARAQIEKEHGNLLKALGTQQSQFGHW